MDSGGYGQFSLQKYGVVPKSVYPESVSSSSSRELNAILNKLLRQDAQILRDLLASGADKRLFKLRKKTSCKKSLTSLLCHQGFHHVNLILLIVTRMITTKVKGHYTTRILQKYVDLPLEDYVSVINAPTADKPYGKSYTVEMLEMWLVAVRFVISTFQWERLKELAIAQMQTGETVWFGSDVGQLSNRKAGILATDVYDFESSMDIQLTQDKAGRLDYSESLMTHAMVLTGVDLDEMASQPSGRLKTRKTRSVQMVTSLPQTLGWTNTLTKSLFAKNC